MNKKTIAIMLFLVIFSPSKLYAAESSFQALWGVMNDSEKKTFLLGYDAGIKQICIVYIEIFKSSSQSTNMSSDDCLSTFELENKEYNDNALELFEYAYTKKKYLNVPPTYILYLSKKHNGTKAKERIDSYVKEVEKTDSEKKDKSK